MNSNNKPQSQSQPDERCDGFAPHTMPLQNCLPKLQFEHLTDMLYLLCQLTHITLKCGTSAHTCLGQDISDVTILGAPIIELFQDE